MDPRRKRRDEHADRRCEGSSKTVPFSAQSNLMISTKDRGKSFSEVIRMTAAGLPVREGLPGAGPSQILRCFCENFEMLAVKLMYARNSNCCFLHALGKSSFSSCPIDHSGLDD